MTEHRHWSLETDGEDVVWATFDSPGRGANVLSRETLEELGEILAGLEKAPPRGLVIRSGKPAGFIAGADINEFTTIADRDQALALVRRGHAVMDRLERLGCHTLALIHGHCLGGGLELALACRYRVARDDAGTRLGLPEVKLGIHPGFGGTVRTIRDIGAVTGLDLILSGRTVTGREAARIGLVDYAVPERQLLSTARFVMAQRWQPRQRSWQQRLLDVRPARELVAWQSHRTLRQKVAEKHYPAPFAALQLWRQHGGDQRAMLDAEMRSVAGLVTSDTSRNLVRVFQLQEKLKGGYRASGFTGRRLHVVGAGVMGGDIAAWGALRGFRVTLQDENPAAIGASVARAAALFKRRLKAPHRVRDALDRLVPDARGHGVRDADVVIEAIAERLDAKQQVFRDLETQAKPEALLATNTSSLPLAQIGAALQRPDRLVGLHFFNPVAQMQLVEIVSDAATDPAVMQAAGAFARAIDKLPLPVSSEPGFLVNRVLTAYMMEALLLLDEGMPAPAVDRLATDFGMPLGPVELVDSVGLDVALAVGEVLAEPLNLEIPDLLRNKIAAGRLGRKSGGGFYSYAKGRTFKADIPDSYVAPFDAQDRLVLRLLNEAVACLRLGIVADSEQLDAGLVFGAGFAPFRGGPVHYARQRGVKEVTGTLETLAARHGARFAPDAGWNNLAAG